jgi:hypothetical protein
VSATYDEAAHRVAAAEARETYWRMLYHGTSAEEARRDASNDYLDAYENEAGHEFPVEPEFWPSVWEDEATRGAR